MASSVVKLLNSNETEKLSKFRNAFLFFLRNEAQLIIRGPSTIHYYAWDWTLLTNCPKDPTSKIKYLDLINDSIRIHVNGSGPRNRSNQI